MVASSIVKWGPDLLFTHHGRAASANGFLQELHRYGVKTAVYLCDEPYEVGETAFYSPAFKYVFTMDPCTISAHQKAREGRPHVYYLPPGVDTEHFKRVDYDDRDGPSAFFLGNPNLIPRRDWLRPVERVLEGTKICYWHSVAKGGPEWIPLEAHPKVYGNCLIGLNIYRSPAISADCFKKRCLGRMRSRTIPKGMTLTEKMPAKEGTGFWNDPNLPASHVNPRFLEMAACGTLVVSDDSRSEHSRMFPMAPVAENPAHFLELINYYLNHLNEAQEIGRICSYLISRQHTYQHRAAEVLVRTGLVDVESESLATSLGAPEDWLSPQDWTELGEKLSSGRTGRSERWSPAFGKSSTALCGSPSEATSIDVQRPWL